VCIDRPGYAFDIETTEPEWTSARMATIALYSPRVSFVMDDADERRLLRRFHELF
jgi:hypothetical protein